MRQRMAMLLLLLLGLSAPAAAQQAHTVPAQGTAVTCVSAQLVDSPMRGAQALMNYWPGVRVEVTRVVSAEYVQVTVGAKPGSLMGYMRADALYYGEAGVRRVQPYQLRFNPDEQTVMYSYRDVMAQRVDIPEYTYFNVIGESEGWLHLIEDGPAVFYAFAPIGKWTGEQEIAYFAPYVKTAPLEHEMTVDEAIEYAKQRLLADGIRVDSTGEKLTRELLNSLVPEVHVLWYFDDGVCSYSIAFHYAEGMEGYPYICTGADIVLKDGEVVDVSYGNG